MQVDQLPVLISIHALREEGDKCVLRYEERQLDFYPRPPRGGRPEKSRHRRQSGRISIHALREEGDALSWCPPLWWRLFLSTPSARRAILTALLWRRATGWSWKHMGTKKFLSTPSARRATAKFDEHNGNFEISIHALREEGDRLCQCLGC